jgi:hypothetical protein
MTVPEAFFVPDGDDRFVATEHSRGPWSREHQHAGPPSALLARAIERAVAGDAVIVTRLTVELVAPVPIGRLEVVTSTLRAGRTVRRLEATLGADGRVMARASALVTRTTSVAFPPVKPEPRDPLPPPETGEPFRFPVFEAQAIGYQTSVDAQRVRGGFGQNPTAVWIRARVPLVLGEAISPLQRVMIAADSGNGVAVVLDPTQRRSDRVSPPAAGRRVGGPRFRDAAGAHRRRGQPQPALGSRRSVRVGPAEPRRGGATSQPVGRLRSAHILR